MVRRARIAKVTPFEIRTATRADSRQLVDLIIGLAEFERLEPPGVEARSRLVKDIFEKKLIRVFVAGQGGKLLGYALYFFTYSSFLARPTLYLEDIFVHERSRREGVGKALLLRCVKEAARQRCGRMEWQVLNWNRKAMNFYFQLGAKKIEDYRLFRLDEKQFQKVA